MAIIFSNNYITVSRILIQRHFIIATYTGATNRVMKTLNSPTVNTGLTIDYTRGVENSSHCLSGDGTIGDITAAENPDGIQTHLVSLLRSGL